MDEWKLYFLKVVLLVLPILEHSTFHRQCRSTVSTDSKYVGFCLHLEQFCSQCFLCYEKKYHFDDRIFMMARMHDHSCEVVYCVTNVCSTDWIHGNHISTIHYMLHGLGLVFWCCEWFFFVTTKCFIYCDSFYDELEKSGLLQPLQCRIEGDKEHSLGTKHFVATKGMASLVEYYLTKSGICLIMVE